jgi:hypothetical protein
MIEKEVKVSILPLKLVGSKALAQNKRNELAY